jgi:hypothetical protein
VKFSVRQILASAAGAVIAAVIASIFGVKGTIVGVAIGSMAATFGTALVAQSIERGQHAVKQVVKVPDSSTLLRKLGGTGASGSTTGTVDASSAPTEAVVQQGPDGDAEAETAKMQSAAAPAGETARLEISAAADAPATERLRATTLPMQPAPGRAAASRRFSWATIAGTAAIVFVLALLFVTAVELISGKPLSAIFGGADNGTSVKNFFNPTPAPVPTVSTTTSTTSPTSTSTSASTTTTSTSTTLPPGNTTTTTSPAASNTTTTGLGATTTTTTSVLPLP